MSESAKKCSVKGRWLHPLGTVLHEYRDTLKYDIYKLNGTFGTITDAGIPQKWWLEGDTLITKIGTNSYTKSFVEFGCNCNLMKLTTSWRESTWTNNFWKENVDSTKCK
jgi:hypothetical protein